MKTLMDLSTRLVALNSGQLGVRAGLPITCKAVAGDDALMDFIGSDETVDRYNERIRADGWQLDAFRANPVIVNCHDYSNIGNILGRADSVNITEGKLVNRVRFCTDNPMGDLAFKMAKKGFLQSQSVGFIPLEWEDGIGHDQPARTFTKSELLEISMVVVPANPGATIGNQIRSLLNVSERRNLADFIEQIYGKATPSAPGSASGPGVFDARLYNLATSLRGIMSGN